MRYVIAAALMVALVACDESPARPHHANDGVVWCIEEGTATERFFAVACGDAYYTLGDPVICPAEMTSSGSVVACHGTPPIPPADCYCMPRDGGVSDGGVPADH